MSNRIRTRIAPSPTGEDLHIWNAYTALINYVFAKKHGGQFIIRIEDTDRERSTPEAVQVIIEGLKWLGLDWDEGPIYQTDRLLRYQEAVQQLLKDGHAYKCYCSRERLENLRGDQMKRKQKPKYDRHCLMGSSKEVGDIPFVIRFKNQTSGKIIIDDVIHGPIEIDNQELDDLILLRSDGMPTYNLSAVVDDWDMGVTHILRGDDHINNTPRQINLLKALGAKIPVYGHMPMILDTDGKKLSKRSGAASVLDFERQGFLPQTLLNYLVRLGWSHGDQEIFSIEEMIEYFDVHDIHKAPSAMNFEKLLWLNQHYLKTLPPEEIIPHLKPHFDEMGIECENGPSLVEVIMAQRERAKTLKEMTEKSVFFYQAFSEYEEKAEKQLTLDSLPILEAAFNDFGMLHSWQPQDIHSRIEGLCETLSVKLGKIAQPLRIAVTGTMISPPIDITLALLGKEVVLDRIQRAIDFIQAKGVNS